MEIARKLTDKMLEARIVKDEEREIYEYGIRALIILAVNMSTLLIVGIVMNDLLFAISFFCMFATARALFGGIHSKSVLRCYVYSTLIFLAGIILEKNYLVYMSIKVQSTILSALTFIILILKILDNYIKHNRILDKKFFTGVAILFVELIIFFYCYNLFNGVVSRSVLYSFFILSILMAIRLIRIKLE